MTQKFQLFNYTVERELVRSETNDEVPDNIRCISAPSQWYDTEGADVIVGVIDTGSQLDHDDLKEAIVDSRNFCKGGDPANANDDNGHGTHVLGIIAARRNGTGVCGVAPKCKVVIAKALDRNGTGNVNDIIAALKWLTDWKGGDGTRVDVINMSLGMSEDVPKLHRAIQAAVNRGITVVAAMGNLGDASALTDEISYPAYYPEVISVGSVNNQGESMGFSNTNKEADVSAPGSKIKSTMLDNRLGLLSGTSMSCPHISGAIALIINKYFNRTEKRPSPEVIAHFVRYFTNRNTSVGMDCSLGAGSFNFLVSH